MRTFTPALAVALAAVLTAFRAAAAPDASVTDGKSIFQTGVDGSRVNVAAAQRPPVPACAACHRANGAGGVHVRGAVSADLRHAALTGSKPPYTPALLERAISSGIDNENKPLNRVMPRWHLSKHDLHAVATFVWTQLK